MTLRTCCLFICVSITAFSQYQVTELPGGPLKRDLYAGIYVNKDSNLDAKIFLLNHPQSGIDFSSVQLSLEYKDRQNQLNAKVTARSKSIVALKYRITLFDVFGEHITNLAAGEIKDYPEGEFQEAPKWRAYDDDILGWLTATVYVYKVRFSDGTIWKMDEAEIGKALSALRLTDLKENQAKGK